MCRATPSAADLPWRSPATSGAGANVFLNCLPTAIGDPNLRDEGLRKMLEISEGIETDRELRTLRELGVRYGQGYYFGAALRAH